MSKRAECRLFSPNLQWERNPRADGLHHFLPNVLTAEDCEPTPMSRGPFRDAVRLYTDPSHHCHFSFHYFLTRVTPPCYGPLQIRDPFCRSGGVIGDLMQTFGRRTAPIVGFGKFRSPRTSVASHTAVFSIKSQPQKYSSAFLQMFYLLRLSISTAGYLRH